MNHLEFQNRLLLDKTIPAFVRLVEVKHWATYAPQKLTRELSESSRLSFGS